MNRHYSADEVVNRGKSIYERKLKDQVDAENSGRWLIIEVDSEDYEIGDDSLELAHRLHRRHPDAPLYAMKIGQEAPVRIGASLRRGPTMIT